MYNNFSDLIDLTEAERVALVNLLTETIETSRYPPSPRIQTLRTILEKLEPIASTEPPELIQPSRPSRKR